MSLSPLEEALVTALRHIADSTAASWVQDFANDAIALAEKTALERKSAGAPLRCVCNLRGISYLPICGLNFNADHPSPTHCGISCGNPVSEFAGVYCGHDRACHPHPQQPRATK